MASRVLPLSGEVAGTQYFLRYENLWVIVSAKTSHCYVKEPFFVLLVSASPELQLSLKQYWKQHDLVDSLNGSVT